VCLAAILKDEDPFVEEWVAYHRLLGVDHFYLYDNDPRQPLSEILALHRDYVTVRDWLIDHADPRYPGRNKQLKAYIHCLEHDAANYEWVTFLDCDEFIVLEEHLDLKAFLNEFEAYDSIALNWHVFGHNGHYENPPGLVIESLTRRMKDPRARTKSFTRPDAIASIDSAHQCDLKSGRKCVDANKRRYREELYPGKTRIARINHYQCRSFTNWMRKPERGEAGAFADDPANAWRFSQEGCLRQFVSQIALDRNECLDTSMLRHAEPIKRYLNLLRSAGGLEGKTQDDIATLRTQRAPSEIETRRAPSQRDTRSLERPTGNEAIGLTRGAPGASSLLLRNLCDARPLSLLISGERNRAVADAKAASRSHDWPQAIWRWRRIIDESGDKAPPTAFLALSKALKYHGDFEAAVTVAWDGRTKHPTDLRLIANCANMAMATKRWSEAAACWRAVLNRDGDASAAVYRKLSRAYRYQGDLAKAEEIIHQGRAAHPGDISLNSELAKIAMVRKDWREAIGRWRRLIDEFGDKAPPKAFLALCDAHRRLGDLGAAQAAAREGRAKHPTYIRLAVQGAEIAIERAEIAMDREEWCQAAEQWQAVLDFQTAANFALDRPFATACMGLIACNNYDRVIPAVQDLKRRDGESKLLLAIEGIAYLRSSLIEDARFHWTRYWQRAIQDQDFAHQPAPVCHRRPSNDFFPTLARSREDIAERVKDRFCVYTALFGEYDSLRSPAFVPPGVKFICFSDRERDIAGWEVRVIDLELDIPALKNRKIKILPYDYLKDFDCSLYIDANIVFLADPIGVYHRWLKGESFVAWAHPERSGVYEEIEAILMGLRHPPAPLLDQYAYFGDQAAPEQSGLIEASFLWRDHRDVRVRELMQQWWDFLVRFGGHRDQPALGYLMWKSGTRPAILPDYLGTSRDNEFFCGLPHLQTAVELERANAPQRGANGDSARDIARGSPGRRRGLPPRLTWVCRNRFKAVASTFMRGHQLSEIARLSLTSMEVNYVDEYHLGSQSDSILILTKGFLKEACVDELAGLKERGNIICADYVDDPGRPELHECLDVYIAASITQFIHYSRHYADKLVHLITHHSDPRLEGIRGPQDYCNIGFFGEIVNARYAHELQGIIDFSLTNTQVLEAGWIPKLRHCNVHYAVREPGSAEGFKPFLKGFTAAQCHSNIIVPKDESDARYYLGSDYPYILTDAALESVLEMIDRVKESFGGAEWRRGLDVMESVRRRCDATQIETEIKALLTRC
jgi:tetratricopeptide (TPR) repeat protein